MTEPGGENRRGRSAGAASHEFVADLLGLGGLRVAGDGVSQDVRRLGSTPTDCYEDAICRGPGDA